MKPFFLFQAKGLLCDFSFISKGRNRIRDYPYILIGKVSHVPKTYGEQVSSNKDCKGLLKHV